MSVVEKAKKAIGLDERSTARRAKRRQIAECLLAEQRQGEQRERIAACKARTDEAVSVHAAKCAPIQERLGELEAAMLSAIADREEVKPAIGSERAKLLGELDQANRDLEAVTILEHEQFKKLHAELQAMQYGTTPRVVFENELCRPPLANPEWYARHHALQYASEAMRMAGESARAKVMRTADYNDGRHENEQAAQDIYAARDALWRAASTYCGVERDRMVKEMNDLRKKMLDE